MSDTILAALIAGGVGVVGSITTFLATRSQAKTAIKTVESHASVELQKVEAENERLRQQHRETERSHRQGTYHRLLANLDQQALMASDLEASPERYDEIVKDFYFLTAAVNLFGADPVRDAMQDVIEVLGRMGSAIARESGSPLDGHRSVYPRFADELAARELPMIEAMRADIATGILPAST
jgi:ribosomal protein S20